MEKNTAPAVTARNAKHVSVLLEEVLDALAPREGGRGGFRREGGYGSRGGSYAGPRGPRNGGPRGGGSYQPRESQW